jgi:hypothetical protein
MMKNRIKIALLLSICLLSVFIGNAQQLDSVFTPPPIKFIESVSQKAQKISSSVDAKTEKTLASFTKWEHKLLSKISKKDSAFAKQIQQQAKAQLENISTALKNPIRISQYIPGLDSAATSLQFLSSITYAKEIKEKLSQSLENVELLKSQLQKAEALKRFLIARKNEWKTQLEKFGLAKNFKKLSKTVYYYQQQLAEYKNILNDPRKIERKALELLSKTKPWKDFFKKHSQLASLFRLPGVETENENMPGFAGLQTRVQVMSYASSYGSHENANQNLFSILKQKLQSVSGSIESMRDKINGMTEGADHEIPDFRPNNQKVKSFGKRLVFGTNFQTLKSNRFFPTTTDLGFSLGYKLTDKNTIGLGTSLKMGWGNDIQHIKISGEGVSIRAFVDIKLHKLFFLNGGFEYNYQQSFDAISRIYDTKDWRESGLIGISKTLKMKSRFFKTTRIYLLYDFLYKNSLPVSPAIKMRVAYFFE